MSVQIKLSNDPWCQTEQWRQPIRNIAKPGPLTLQTDTPCSGQDIPNGTPLFEAIHKHLTDLGFSKNGKGYFVEGGLTKQKIRDLHSAQRKDVLKQRQSFVETQGPALVKHFATGREVNPTAIDPEIVEVKPDSLDSRLFRFACLLWSVPVSQGFGGA